MFWSFHSLHPYLGGTRIFHFKGFAHHTYFRKIKNEVVKCKHREAKKNSTHCRALDKETHPPNTRGNHMLYFHKMCMNFSIDNIHLIVHIVFQCIE